MILCDFGQYGKIANRKSVNFVILGPKENGYFIKFEISQKLNLIRPYTEDICQSLA